MSPSSARVVEDPGPESIAGDRLGARYRLLSPLGRGAAARVFLGQDEYEDELVAVKVMPRYGASPLVTPERFDAEVRVGRGVPHPNVARVLDSGTSALGEPFVVIEALAGETLGDRLRRDGALPVREALVLGREAARGLSAMHRRGFVHRDVKPDNLFLCDGHDVALKVIDFGFSTRVDAPTDAERRVMGTLEYIAPEQALAEVVDGRADVYSLGVVLFRALTGQLPFDACARRGILTHHLMSPLPPVSWLRDGVDDEVDRLVLSATRKHPDNRYATMEAFLWDIDAWLDGAAVFGAAPSVSPDAYRPSTSRGHRVLSTLVEEWDLTGDECALE